VILHSFQPVGTSSLSHHNESASLPSVDRWE
jgi:hypothetical protein